jgi:hypothetical protein
MKSSPPECTQAENCKGTFTDGVVQHNDLIVIAKHL